MAERRMFAKTIVLSDAFLDMPLSARCLYFTLGMLADDDGFVNSPKSIMRQCGSSEDDMRLLLAKKFLLSFETGVIVIKHWKINNYLRNDRYKETSYLEEKQQLVVEPNGAYTIEENTGIPYNGIPSIGKDRLGKDRLGKDRLGKDIPQQTDLLVEESELNLPATVDNSINTKGKKKTYKNGLDNPNKIHVAESVALTESEHKKLIERFGETETKKLLDWFSSKKLARGYVYASDYHALLNWGILEWQNSRRNTKGGNENLNDIAAGLCSAMGDSWNG